MKTKVDSDEWYPVWSFGTYGEEIEVSQQTLDDWKRVFDEFDRVQAEIKKAFNLKKLIETTQVSDATITVAGDIIIISDHENTLRFNREGALQLLKHLPKLVLNLPITS